MSVLFPNLLIVGTLWTIISELFFGDSMNAESVIIIGAKKVNIHYSLKF